MDAIHRAELVEPSPAIKSISYNALAQVEPGKLEPGRHRSGSRKRHSRPPRIYRFTPDQLDRVRKCCENDNWHGVLEMLRDWAVIVCAAAISLYAWHHFGLVLPVVVYGTAVYFIGGRQRGLADILHQAAHGTLVKSRQFGVVLGTLFSGYPLLQSLTGYTDSHVRHHHPYLGDPVLDPDYVEYQRRGLTGPNLRRKALYRYLRALVGVRSTIGYIQYLIKNRILNAEEAMVERWIRFAYALAALGICIWQGWLITLAGYWFVPLITTHAWVGSFIELLEHYPLIETAPLVNIYMTRNRECGPVVNFLLGLQAQEGYHLVHHLFPKVPRWRLREVHQILMEDPEYAAHHRATSSKNLVRDLFCNMPD